MRIDLGIPATRDQHAYPCIVDVQVRTKCWLEVDGRFAIGQHGFELLRAISRHRSLAGAARDVGWSYRHAWDYLRRAEQAFGCALVNLRAGKGRQRGMQLSTLGRQVVRLGGSLRVPNRSATLRMRAEHESAHVTGRAR
jgi:molybdate transport system regulatory protein